MPSASSDRNLLFGILALQLDFISRDQLLAAMNAWVLDKIKPLGDILRAQNALSADRLLLLDALVQEHLKQHGDDPHESLAALSSVSSARKLLDQVRDPDLETSLAAAGAGNSQTEPVDPFATTGPPPGSDAKVRFRILRPHAKGGLGEVFLARDEELGREVALKEIQARHADDATSRNRFLLEAEITGGLEHPGIVPVYGLGTYADGRPYYAMRFIKGDSLKEAIALFHAADVPGRDAGERNLALRQLLRRFFDVCHAIDYAHHKGVLHRDLKPANIMLGKYGETLVVDWGLAKSTGKQDPASATDESLFSPQTASGSQETLPGSYLGTPAYMSPEQAAGKLHELGPASDVYSLGATLYCLLTGRAPVEDHDIGQLLRKVQRGEFPPPRTIKPQIAPALEAICLKAMALKPAERYGTPHALADDIEHWLADEPVSAWPEPWTVRSQRWIGQHRTLVAGTAAALIVGVVSLLLSTLLLSAANENERLARLKAQDKEAEANDERKKAVDARAVAVAASTKMEAALKESQKQKKKADDNWNRAEWKVYAGNIALAQVSWQENNVRLGYHYLDSCRQELRGWEHDYLYTLFIKNQQTLKGHTDFVTSVAFSGDSKRIVSGSLDSTVKVWEATTGQETLTLNGHTYSVQSVAFSSDGKRIVSGGYKTVKVWDATTGQETLTLKGHTSGVSSVAFSSDGKRIVSGGYNTVKVWDAITGQETLNLKGHTDGVTSVAFSRDGKRIVSGSRDNTVKVWDATTGQETLNLKGHTSEVSSVVFSRDGKRIVSGSYDYTVKVWDAITGQETLTLKGHTSEVSSVAFSSDGKRIVSGSLDSTVKVWDAITGQETLNLKGHTDGVTSVAFSGDGMRIVSGSYDYTVKVWDAITGQETLTLKGHTSSEALSVAFSSDGKRIGSGSWDKTVKVWDATTGQETLTLKGHTSGVSSMAFSSDGKRIVSGSWDNTVKVWDATTGQETLTLKGHTSEVSSVAFSSDGKRIVSGSLDSTVKVWDAITGQETLNLKGHTDGVTSVAFSSDGMRIVSGGRDNTVKVWDATTGQETLTLKGHTSGVSSVAFSRDGKRIVSGSSRRDTDIKDTTVKVWDAMTGQETFTLKGHTDQVTSVSFSGDGMRIGSGSLDRTVKVWDAATGQETLTLKGHTKGVNSVSFSGDGKRIVSGSWDKTVKVWDATMRQEIVPPPEALR